MLLPKKTKYRKYQRGRRRGYAKGQTNVQAGDFGLKALENGWVTNRQIEAARIAMTRKIRRGADGLGQGRSGALGRRDQARPGHVRAGRRAGAVGEGGAPPRGPEAPDQDESRQAGGRSLCELE